MLPPELLGVGGGSLFHMGVFLFYLRQKFDAKQHLTWLIYNSFYCSYTIIVLWQAEEVKPGFWISNSYWIGKVLCATLLYVSHISEYNGHSL